MATGWDNQEPLHLPALAADAEGAPQPSLGFGVRKTGSLLNASQNRGVLMAWSGDGARSLWLLSMMCRAGRESA